MLPLTTTTLLLASLGLASGLVAVDKRSPHDAEDFCKKKCPPSKACLVPKALQTASLYTGLEEGTAGIRPGLSESATDSSNFVNFCAGRTVTDGKQNREGSCNGIPMGRIPATTNMISSIITYPQPGDRVKPDTTFNVTIQTSHLRAGFLVNPVTNYYTAPQDLDENGDIIGHCHISIQKIGSLRTMVVPDPTQFAFFKGVDDEGDGKGGLQAEVTGGLPAGAYRVCTMIAARNHQPVVMPVANRGAQDDCTKFEIGA